MVQFPFRRCDLFVGLPFDVRVGGDHQFVGLYRDSAGQHDLIDLASVCEDKALLAEIGLLTPDWCVVPLEDELAASLNLFGHCDPLE